MVAWPPCPCCASAKRDERRVCACRSALSDVRSKRDFAELNRTALLEGLEALPVRSWRYKAQGEGVRHIGPTAQDFHRLMGAFLSPSNMPFAQLHVSEKSSDECPWLGAAGGFGESETLISSVDADGVALASVQAVYERVRQQDRQIGAHLSTRPLSCRRDFGLTRRLLRAATMSSALAAGAEREAAMQRRLERLERLVETALAAV